VGAQRRRFALRAQDELTHFEVSAKPQRILSYLTISNFNASHLNTTANQRSSKPSSSSANFKTDLSQSV